MKLNTFDKEVVLEIHEHILNPKELKGLAGDKSLESVLARVENRLDFGLIDDEFDLTASYACVLAVGHVFNDGNKRTSMTVLDLCLVNHPHL